jgi:hypothetical protein
VHDHITCSFCKAMITEHRQVFNHIQCTAPAPEKSAAADISIWGLTKRVNRLVRKLDPDRWRTKPKYPARVIHQTKVKR